ncbi:MAG: T9SS type A sorting domain-containing protein [Janthinobacterium lividum]
MVSLRFFPAAGRLGGIALALLSLSSVALAQTPTRILFVGNSFTHGKYAPVLNYNSAAVTDENYGLPSTDPRYESVASEPGPWGGIPGIFKKFTDEAGLNYEVHIEAISGNSLQYHYANALSVIAQASWNKVVLQEVSDRPIPTSRGGNRSAFYTAATSLEQAIHTANPQAQVYLYETWARADLTYPAGQPYSGLPIDTMTADLHNGYYRAYFNNSRLAGVAPAGDAWLSAITTGVATRNPYTPDATKLNLWAVDYYHPSKWGSYLNACVLFYRITGVDPRTLGASEQAAVALGITPAAAVALQQLAYQQVNVVVTPPAIPTAAAFTPGNFVAVRAGDGSAALTSAATPVFLAEYTPTGTLVQTIPLPTADAGSNRAFTNSGTATSDNNMTRSADGRYLVLTGYNATPGTASITGTTTAATNRIIGRVAADGSLDTSTRIDDAFSATNFRSAASADGSTFYAAGGNSGIRYLPFGNTGPTTALSAGALVNFRAINIFGGNLYVSSAASPNYGVNQIGTGLPTAAGAAVTLLPGFPAASGPSSYGIYFADLSPAVPGVDVVYVADDNPTGGIQKWSLAGGTWALNGTIGGSTTALLRGLTGSRTGTAVQLVASGGGGLYTVLDNAGYNAAPSTTALPAPLVTPPANTAFRGVAFAPVATALAARPAASGLAAEVFPVPAAAQLLVRLPATSGSASAQVALFTSLGQQVLSQQLPTTAAGTTLSLNVEGLRNGVYTLRVQVGEQLLSKQVVILH